VFGIRFAVADALEDHDRTFADGQTRNLGVDMKARLIPRARVVLVTEVRSGAVIAASARKMKATGR
jgi:hypothetical protein